MLNIIEVNPAENKVLRNSHQEKKPIIATESKENSKDRLPTASLESRTARRR